MQLDMDALIYDLHCAGQITFEGMSELYHFRTMESMQGMTTTELKEIVESPSIETSVKASAELLLSRYKKHSLSECYKKAV